MFDLKVYIITGMPGAGKEELVQIAMSKGYDVIRMGDVVRSEAEKRNIQTNDRGIGGFANEERQKFGMGIWAARCIPFLKGKDTVIDGSRGLEELSIFKKELGEDLRLLAIHTSPGKRFIRLQKRARADAPRTYDDFLERDDRELGWGLGSLIALADIMLINEGTLDEFRASVRAELG